MSHPPCRTREPSYFWGHAEACSRQKLARRAKSRPPGTPGPEEPPPMSPPKRSVWIKIRARKEERAEWHRKARGTEKGDSHVLVCHKQLSARTNVQALGCLSLHSSPPREPQTANSSRWQMTQLRRQEAIFQDVI